VYQGAPLVITLFFATIPKVALVFLFLKVFYLLNISFFYNLALFFGLVSVIYGTLLALYEVKVMRMFAFASISHIGYILIGMTQISIAGISNIMFYLFMYVLLVLAFFLILLNLQIANSNAITLTDLCKI
jgi:NADH-quinone oxidoreductase subunit N